MSIPRIAKFFKVSTDRFVADFIDRYGFDSHDPNAATAAYEMVRIPERSTSGSAGYDFYTPVDFFVKPGETYKFPTGIRCQINEGWVLNVYPRSSVGFKHGIMLSNTVGIIDSDYFNAKNEGHIWVKLYNTSDQVFEAKAGDRICQGVFLPYGVTIDDAADGERTNGIGSTGV